MSRTWWLLTLLFTVTLCAGFNIYEASVVEEQRKLIQEMIKNPACIMPEVPKHTGGQGNFA